MEQSGLGEEIESGVLGLSRSAIALVDDFHRVACLGFSWLDWSNPRILYALFGNRKLFADLARSDSAAGMAGAKVSGQGSNIAHCAANRGRHWRAGGSIDLISNHGE